MRICDLREKEVINICDGERLGFVEDVEFDLCTGKITHIIIPGPCKFFGVLGREEEYVIEICHICKIGTDLILVEVNKERVTNNVEASLYFMRKIRYTYSSEKKERRL